MEKDALRWVLDAAEDNARNSAILHIAVFSAVRPGFSGCGGVPSAVITL
jgi:hypothetical protein